MTIQIPEYDVAEEQRVKEMTYEEMLANLQKHIEALVVVSTGYVGAWKLDAEQEAQLHKLFSDVYAAGMTASRHFHVWERAQKDHD